MGVSERRQDGSAADFRLPAATRLGVVRLQVADLDRSLAFYRDVLGLTLHAERDESKIAASSTMTTTLTAADGTPVVELTEQRGAKPVPPRGRLGLYHFAILLPDRRFLARFARHLSSTGVRVGASDHLVSEAFYLQDPDGLGIEVYADRPHDTWRFQDGQLVMDTRPLDVQNLLLEAGYEPWEGMPAGTVLGHVHLHVGDIGKARSFYHSSVGFDEMVWSYPGALFLAAGGYHHHLGVNTWAGGAAIAGEADARLLEWELVVPGRADAAAVAESIARNGFEVSDAGNSYVTSDPWNVQLRIRW